MHVNNFRAFRADQLLCNLSYSGFLKKSVFLSIKLPIMKKNMGNIDRGIRLLVVLVIAYLLFIGKQVDISSLLGTILAVAGAVFLLTSLVSWCGIYSLLGLSTCPVKAKE